jgi:hypothetical protein
MDESIVVLAAFIKLTYEFKLIDLLMLGNLLLNGVAKINNFWFPAFYRVQFFVTLFTSFCYMYVF